MTPTLNPKHLHVQTIVRDCTGAGHRRLESDRRGPSQLGLLGLHILPTWLGPFKRDISVQIISAQLVWSSELHCLRHLFTVKSGSPGAMHLRQRGHDFVLPNIRYEFNKRHFRSLTFWLRLIFHVFYVCLYVYVFYDFILFFFVAF